MVYNLQLSTISMDFAVDSGTTAPPDRQVCNRRGILKSIIKAYNGDKEEFTECLAALDTGASMSLVQEGSPYILRGKLLRKAKDKLGYLSDMMLIKAVDEGKTVNVKTANGETSLTKVALITVVLNGKMITMPALVMRPGSMPSETEVLIDMAAIEDSGLLGELSSVSRGRKAWQTQSKAQSSDDVMIHKGAYPCNVYVPKSAQYEGDKPDKEESTKHKLTEKMLAARINKLVKEFLRAEVMLSEANCRIKIEENPGIFAPKPLSLDDVDVASNLRPNERDEAIEILEEFREVFAENDGLPKAMNEKFAPRVKLMRDPSVKKAYQPKPKWGKYQEKVLQEWAKHNLENGFLEVADIDRCEYAMRPHICLKPGGNGLRVAFDAKLANRAFPKLPVNLTNMEDQLRRHRGAKYFLQTDALRGYHQMGLDEESRDICAIWTPQGLLRPTRLVEGLKNSGTLYQGPITRILAEMSEKARATTSNYMDDFLVSGRTFEEFVSNVREFFRVCKMAGITLSPKKTKFGYDTAKMVGRELHGNTITVHDDNLRAVRQAVEPTDKQQLKRFLGVCQYAAKHVEDYAKIAKPLFNLTSKKAEWRWEEGGPEQTAWRKLKDAVAQKFQLETPDYSKPMYLYTDASDDGMGAHLCQFQNSDGEVVALSDEEIQVVGDERKRTLAFYSAAFDEAMKKKPVFYREARAMIWAMTKAKEFIDKCAHELVVVTDHQPLKWIQQSERGQVTAWLLESVSETPFRVVYLNGPKNTTADALSRIPLINPNECSRLGTREVWKKLLDALPNEWKAAEKICALDGKHTNEVHKQVQDWRVGKNPIGNVPMDQTEKLKEFDLILVRPPVEHAPTYVYNFLKAFPQACFACLVPSDLVQLISSAGKNIPKDEACDELVHKKSTKIAFLALNQTWLIFNLPRKVDDIIVSDPLTVRKAEIFTGEVLQAEVDEGAGANSIKVAGGILERWIAAQALDREQIKAEYGDEVVLTDGNGLIYIKIDGQAPKIYVPKSERKELVMKTHHMLAHGLMQRVRKVISDTHIWPKMFKDIHNWLQECVECPLAKAKKRIAHNQYSPLQFRRPRNAYGIDFYAIEKSDSGYVGVLTLVDLFTRFVLYIPIKDETAVTASTVILHNVIYGRGPFRYLVSDGAKALTGSIIQNLTQSWGIDHIKTFYWPQGNAITERNHVVLGEFLRLLPEDRRSCWEQDIPALAYAVNMSVNSATGFSPFELDCGYQPPSLHDVAFQELPVEVQDLLPQTYQYSKDEFAAYQARTQALHEIAARYADAARMVEMENLNSEHGPTVTFEPEEKVIIYAPPGQERKANENSFNWKSKHRLQWKRAKVLKKLSKTTYLLEDESGKKVQRSVALIVRDRSASKEPTHDDSSGVAMANAVTKVNGESSSTGPSDTSFCVGDLVAALQTENSNTYEIALITNLTTNYADLRYYGTTNSDVDRAVFKLGWQIKEGLMMLTNTKPHPKEKPEEYVGRVHRDLLVAKVTLTAQGKIDAESKRKLQQKSLVHHYLAPRDKKLTTPSVESKASKNNKRKMTSDNNPKNPKNRKQRF